MKRTKMITLVVAIQIIFIIDLSQSAVASCSIPGGTATCGENELYCPPMTVPGNCCAGYFYCNEDNMPICSPFSDLCDYSTEKCDGGKCKNAIELISFTATSHDGTVMLEWATDMEIDNVGFHLWRSETEDGEYIKITDNLITAQGSNYQYSFIDDTVVAGKTYYYKLEDMDIYGTSTFHGPVSTKRSNNGLLPAIQLLLRN